MVNASQRMASYMALTSFLIGAAYCAYLVGSNADIKVTIATFVILAELALTGYTTHYETIYRTSQNFNRLSIVLTGQNALSLATIALPIYFGFHGLLARAAILPIVNFLLRRHWLPVHAQALGRISDIRELIHIGFPMLVSGYIFTLLMVADRSLIALWMGPESVGHYTLASMIVTALMIVPGTLSSILYPKAAIAYAQESDPSALRKFVLISLSLNLGLLAPILLISYIVLEPFTLIFLPAYVEGLPAAKIALLSGLAMALTGPGIVFGTLRKNTLHIIVLGLSIITCWILGSLMIHQFQNIVYAALAKVIALFMLGVFVVIYSLHLTRKQPAIEEGPC